MRSQYVFAGILSLCFCALLPVSGCGSNTKAGGSVTFSDGTPVDRGMVKFSDGQHQYTGQINANGTFELGGLKPGDGLPPGTYRVSVIGAVGENDVPLVEAKYESSEESGISFDVAKGRNEPFKITVERYKASRSAQ